MDNEFPQTKLFNEKELAEKNMHERKETAEQEYFEHVPKVRVPHKNDILKGVID